MENEEEIWKKIDGYENYEVSNLGNVKNSDTGNIFKLNTKNGYKYVTLRNSKKDKSYRVNRLVALAFIPNDDPENKTYVNHIDGKKFDNSVKNLEWITPSNSVIHALETGLLKKTQAKKVHQCDKEGNLIKTFESITEASKETGINTGSITKACKSKQAPTGNFIWKFDDESRFCKQETNEELTPIKNYPDYGITKSGKVYSHRKKRFLAEGDLDGYSRVYLTNKKIRKGYLVHNLVGRAFIPNPENKPQVNHINKKRKDNRIENLEWATGPENVQHSVQFNKEVKKQELQKQIVQLQEQVSELEKQEIQEQISQLQEQVNELQETNKKRSKKILVKGKSKSNNKSNQQASDSTK